MKKTALQYFYEYYLNNENENQDVNFDANIKNEKEQMKSAFIAGIFARDFMNKPNFDLDKQFDKWYYKEFD